MMITMMKDSNEKEENGNVDDVIAKIKKRRNTYNYAQEFELGLRLGVLGRLGIRGGEGGGGRNRKLHRRSERKVSRHTIGTVVLKRRRVERKKRREREGDG